MKRIVLLFILIPIGLFSQVNFSTYGATNNGTSDDDTAELQAALDSEANLIADADATFVISSKLDIDTVSNQTIDWNGATIICNTKLVEAIDINKNGSNGGTTTMSNLLFDGQDIVVRAIKIESRVIFNNVDVKDLNQGSQGTQSPAGFFIYVRDDADSMGLWEFNDCDISNLVGASTGVNSNCVVASNTDGSVNGVLFYWDVVPTIETVITWNNLNVDGMWGDDGGGVFINNITGLKNTTSKHVFNGGSIKNCERRALKGFASNMEFNGMTFESPVGTNPNIQCGTVSGLAVFGAADRENIHFDNCTFIGTDYESRVIPIAVKNWSIKNSTFLGSYSTYKTIDMTDLSGTGVFNGLIECNTFASGHEIGEYAGSGWTDGTVGIGGNTWAGSPNITLDSGDYYVTTPTCTTVTPTCNDGIQNGDETGVDCGGSCDPCTPTPQPQNERIKALRRLLNSMSS